MSSETMRMNRAARYAMLIEAGYGRSQESIYEKDVCVLLCSHRIAQAVAQLRAQAGIIVRAKRPSLM